MEKLHATQQADQSQVKKFSSTTVRTIRGTSLELGVVKG
jgi:hypothetical protein